MSGNEIAILGSSVLATALLGLFPTIRRWWASLRQRPGLALLLIVVTASTFLGGSRSGAWEQQELVDTSRALRVVVVGILFLWAGSIVLRKPACWRLGGAGIRWMLIYSCLAVTSAVYSLYPALTLWKAFEVLTLVVCGYALATEVRTTDYIRRLLEVQMLILLFFTITVLMGVIISPQEAFKDIFAEGNPSAEGPPIDRSVLFAVRGVAPEINPSAVGGIAASLALMTAAPFFAPVKAKDKLGIVIVLILAGAALVLAHSRTSIFALCAAVSGILVLKRQYAASLWIGLATAITLLLGNTQFITEYIYRGQSQEQLASISGRGEFWGLVFDKFLDAPIFGYGFYASHRILFKTSGVDNTYLTVLLGVGIVGFIPFLASVLYAAQALLRTIPRRHSEPMLQIVWIQLFGIFSVTFIRSLTGTSFEVFYHLLVFYLLILISLASLQRQLLPTHAPVDLTPQRRMKRPLQSDQNDRQAQRGES